MLLLDFYMGFWCEKLKYIKNRNEGITKMLKALPIDSLENSEHVGHGYTQKETCLYFFVFLPIIIAELKMTVLFGGLKQ